MITLWIQSELIKIQAFNLSVRKDSVLKRAKEVSQD